MKILIPIFLAAFAAMPLHAADDKKKSEKSLPARTGESVGKAVGGTKDAVTKTVDAIVPGGDAVSREDKEFLKNASEMGRTEVAMGKLAQKKGGPKAKELGAKLVADHTKSNAELKALIAKKKVELKDEPTSAEKKMLESLGSKTGAEFDKEFFEHAKKDHEKAIKTFTDAAKDTKDPDVKAFANKNLKALHTHHKMASQ